MRYFGGKAKIATKIARFLNNIRKENQLYVEPFVGSGNVAYLMDDPKECSDNCPDLIMLWQEIQEDTFIFPDFISEEYYNQLKLETQPSAIRAFAGFGCANSGKFFSGYARDSIGKDRNFASNAANVLKRKRHSFRNTKFECKDYKDVKIENALIYCDPPYSNVSNHFLQRNLIMKSSGNS